MKCMCISDWHDECERFNATCILTFSWGKSDIPMCEFCAKDWCERHPSTAEMIKVG